MRLGAGEPETGCNFQLEVRTLERHDFIILGSVNREIVVRVSDGELKRIRRGYHLSPREEKVTLSKAPPFDRDFVYLNGQEYRIFAKRIGGGAANAAIGIKRLGGNPLLITALSGRYERTQLTRSGIDFCGLSRFGCSVGIDFVSESAGHVLFGFRGRDKEIATDAIRHCLPERPSAILAVGAKLSHIIALRETLATHQLTLFLGPSMAVLKDLADGGISQEVLRRAKAVQLNEQELTTILPGHRLSTGVFALHDWGIGRVFVTRSKDGGVASDGNGQVHWDAYPVRGKVVDATGAGDGFLTAYAWYITRGKSYEEAFMRARIAASYIVTQYGGATMPTSDWVDRHYCL